MAARLAWSESGDAEVQDLSQLRSLLEDLNRKARHRPFFAVLKLEGVGSLTIGVGREQSVLSYTQASGEPPYPHSVGANPKGGSASIVFDYWEEPTEVPLSAAIPADLAMRAVEFFFLRGELPSFVEWEG
jgi:hypothetical protein